MTNSKKSADGEGWMSIGALSQATNIPVGTIRSWEQRYGFPSPDRLASGHRRYALTDVGHLRLIKQALDKGNRAAAVVPASEEVLRRLAGANAVVAANVRAAGHVDRLMTTALALDELAFDLCASDALSELGAGRFVHECVLPFLREVGTAWAQGRLGVMHEHFASSRVRALIDDRRRTHPGSNTVVCAALPGERHDLALHVAALLLSVMRLPVLLLGADTPIEEVAGAVAQRGAVGVLIGSSHSTSADVLVPQLASLRRIVSPKIRIAAGGTTRVPNGVDLLEDFTALEVWAAALTSDTEPAH